MLAFWLTCALEAPWWVLGIRASMPSRLRSRPGGWLLPIVATIVLNLATHPVVWWLTRDRELAVWIMAEVGAVLVEAVLAALVVQRLGATRPWWDAVLLGLGANATSALVGVLFF